MKKLILWGLSVIFVVFVTGCTPNTYTLTIEDPHEFLYEQPAKKYHADETVVIKTHIIYDADLECFVNGKSIGTSTPAKTGDTYTHWEYSFVMPAEDVSITFKGAGVKPG